MSTRTYLPADVREVLSREPLRLLIAVSQVDAESNDTFYLEFALSKEVDVTYLIIRRRFHEMHPNRHLTAYISGERLIEAELAAEDDDLRWRALFFQLLDEQNACTLAK